MEIFMFIEVILHFTAARTKLDVRIYFHRILLIIIAWFTFEYTSRHYLR